MKILIVEDDSLLRQQLHQQLKNIGFDCLQAEDGMEGFFKAKEYPIDLAVIDLGLPKIDGIELIKRLRADGKTFPILILTARGGWKSKVEGLDAGADDYMEKPFHVEELAARCRALLRRAVEGSNIISAGPVQLDLSAQQVFVAEQLLDLTAFEYKIVEYFMRHQGKVVSKSVLTDYLYEQDFDRDSNVIEVLVGRVRKKISAVEPECLPIVTMRGRGYMFQKQSER